MWQLKLILWKTWTIRKRHYLLTTVETLIPIVLFMMMAYGRAKISGLSKQHINETTYSSSYPVSKLYSHYFPAGTAVLWYSPKSEFNSNIIKKVKLLFQLRGQDIQGFDREEDLMQHHSAVDTLADRTVFMVIFHDTNSADQIDYTIRMDGTNMDWKTNQLFSWSASQEPYVDNTYYKYKLFMTLQIAIDTAFVTLRANLTRLPYDISLQDFPYPPHDIDSGLSDLYLNFLPIITIFSFMFLCPAVLKRLVEERYTGAKELMKMMGMKSWMLWLSWLVHALATNVISILFMLFFMKVRLWNVSEEPVAYCEASVLFVFLLLYSIASITFIFFISTLFERPSIALLAGILAWMLSYFVPKSFAVNMGNRKPWLSRCLLALFPNMALHFGFESISHYQQRGVPLKWSNFYDSGIGGRNDITMLNVLVILAIDAVVFMALTFYVEHIKPGKYGIAKPLHYPLTAIARCLGQFIGNKGGSKTRVANDIGIQLPNVESGNGQTVGIEIRNLYKRYGSVMAVDGLNMNIYKNQITVLLGHNGAGKTTTMSMVTGMISTSGGSIIINGVDIHHRNGLDEVRKSLGLCPQHNLLFTDFNVLEHLQFFAMLKGHSFASATKESLKLLSILNMDDKRNEMVSNLSGGMKRKLCLGIAIVGNSEVLILDEPTSGMDPESRREIWNLLLQWRKTKTILITTHFMEEADVLGDWIAIMANGKLQCYGTPLYLKKKYATGFHLSLMLDTEASTSPTVVNAIEMAIRSVVTETELIRQNGRNVVFMLPLDQKCNFPTLFNMLNEKQHEYGIQTFSVTVTTLEEVFLKAKSELGQNLDRTHTQGLNHLPPRGTVHSYTMISLIYKRWRYFIKKFHLYLPTTILMMCLLLLSIYLGRFSFTASLNVSEAPKLPIRLSMYGETLVLYSGAQQVGADTNTAKLTDYYIKSINQAGSIPKRCDNVTNEIIRKGEEDFDYYKQHMVVALEVDQNNGLNIMHSLGAIHSGPIAVNLVMNAMAKVVLRNSDASISIANAPLIVNKGENIDSTVGGNSPSAGNSNDTTKPVPQDRDVEVGLVWLLLVPLGVLFIMSNFLHFPNSEISTNFTQLQMMCGISPITYWLSNFLFDYATFSTLCTCIMLIITVVVHLLFGGTTIFGVDKLLSGFLPILLVYGIAGIPFVYAFSYKRSVAGGFAFLMMVSLLGSVVGTLTIMGLEACGGGTCDIYLYILRPLLTCFCPPFTFAYVAVKFALQSVQNKDILFMDPYARTVQCKLDTHDFPCCLNEDTDDCMKTKHMFSGSTQFSIRNDLLNMLFGFVVYSTLLIFLDTMLCKRMQMWKGNIWRRIKGIGSKHEYQELSSTDGPSERDSGASLRCQKLQKYFYDKKAVDDVTFSVKNGECYGLLGVNGAGKTTTFRMLTRDLLQNSGYATIEDKSNNELIPITHSKYLRCIGYCPQYDALNLSLSGRELLKVFAMFRGYPYRKSNDVVEHFVRLFGLDDIANKPCGTYSGGNKRKLTIALAFMGFPQNILLDEPTNGVDPGSRRDFWNTLSRIKELQNVSFILSSHSMEECEVLCNRIGIMKSGRIRAEGTLPQLKAKYQKGFTILFKVKSLSLAMSRPNSGHDTVDGMGMSMPLVTVEDFKMAINERFRNVELKDEHSGVLLYHVTDANLGWSNMFEVVEELKNNFRTVVEDYSISETSLEDIFLSVARLEH